MKQFYTFLFICAIIPVTVQSQQKTFFQKITPHHVKGQYAGSIGFVSAGFGYEFNRKKLQADFMYGHVPEKYADSPIHSITGKLTWLPLSLQTSNNIRFNIITAGVLVNYTFGNQYFLFAPGKYPKNYYGFPTALHMGVFAGGAVSRGNLGLYYELGVTDRELANYIQNPGSIAFSDILNIGVGLRIELKS